MVKINDSGWPVTVIPGDDYQRGQATALLLQRMGRAGEKLAPGQQPEIDRLLEFWYESGYCVRAILTCLSVTPDNTSQPPRKKGESLPEYLRSRMKKWYNESEADEFSAARKPPQPGLQFEQWYANNRQRAANNGAYRRPRSPGVRGRQARDEIAVLAASRRKSPLDRMREREERHAAALDSLAVTGQAPLPDMGLRPAEEMTTPRMVAAHAGHRSMPLLQHNVKAILERMRSERRWPTPAEKAVLRSALLDNRHRSALGELEAASAEYEDAPGILSPEGSRMLACLDRATSVETSLEAQIRLVMFAVDQDLGSDNRHPPVSQPDDL
ncbi:hypothetical protein G3I59_13770 [Amycolatopsis rubida]|uniref:Uncharacterized protein n=1 Tax=Amycolatopsis rubida TaxID=112413 RepID=A0ABX0BTH3_9PSEU|nr:MULTISPECIES: hypothetical protein [Amycolatopsis]MYW91643.1 hypothetical protein [Amycolatopsis rubida]NEC56627.1 hypothetical protein [Amycolatopsis rubida]OAP24461.1 hypothetical protein A4R44_04852 [Amycolatopsis sp. M39]